jgi:predicted DNA-binding transcriptional regulator AlpA
MTADEVADFAHMSLPTFYNVRHRGDGPPAVRINGRLRFRPEDVAEWIASRIEQVDA